MARGIQSKKGKQAEATALAAYHRARVAEWSKPRYQYDRRFVRLTLLLDKGEQGLAPDPDPKKGRYNSLAELLADLDQRADERAAVLLGNPGCGKTTLLGRRQLEHAQAELESPSGHTSFFVPLNGYRGASPPEPYEWLGKQWRRQGRGLPDFDQLFEEGRFLFLLDGLNEMPYRQKEDYRERIGLWRAFVQQATRHNNTAVFSCRRLDYGSASLSSEAVAVPWVRVEPLTREQIKEFLAVYLGERGAAVWEILRQNQQQLELYATPFFLRLLVGEVTDTGKIPALFPLIE